MKLRDFLCVRPTGQKRKYRTVNVDHDLHYFLKGTSYKYDIPLSDLINNILSDWKEKFQDQIANDSHDGLKDE